MERIRSLDGLRGVSIILVLISHFKFADGFPWQYRRVTDVGGVGVTVFFVISGFIITYILLNEYAQNGKINLFQFYIKRALRILPVFLLYTLFVIIWEIIQNKNTDNGDLLNVFTFTLNFAKDCRHAFGHLWTLCVEEQFYIIWPALLIIFRSKLKFTIGFLFFYSVFASLIEYKFPSLKMYFLTPFFKFGGMMFSGAFAAVFLFENPSITEYKIFKSNLFQFFAIVLFFGMIYVYNSRKFAIITLPLGGVMMLVCILYIILSNLKPNGTFMYTFLTNKIVQHIGVLSYSIYIWQQFFVNSEFGGFWHKWPQYIILIYLAAVASYYLWEKPFLNLKKKFITTDGKNLIEGKNETKNEVTKFKSELCRS